MIGREAELKRLKDALCATMEDGERQVVTVTGEAGVGKSRLLYEFEDWVDLLPEEIRYFKGRASQGTQSVPW
jgi:predicted ATPase